VSGASKTCVRHYGRQRSSSKSFAGKHLLHGRIVNRLRVQFALHNGECLSFARQDINALVWAAAGFVDGQLS